MGSNPKWTEFDHSPKWQWIQRVDLGSRMIGVSTLWCGRTFLSMPCTQKLNVLFKDGKIIEFIRSVNSTKTDHPFLMIDFKVSKDKYINRGFLIENLIYVTWNNITNCAQRRGWWLLEEKELRHWLNEIKAVQEINKSFLSSFLSPMQKKVPPSY